MSTALTALALDVSVVVCTWNRAASLARTLDSLAAMTPAAGATWEVVVVDNNSTDGTPGVVEAVTARLPVRYVFERQQGLSHARNASLREARGAVIAFLDDDVTVAPDWLACLAKAYQEYPEAVCVGGRVLLRDGEARPAWWDRGYNGVLGECDLGDEVIVARTGYAGSVGIGANLSFRRSFFERHGGFNTALGRIGARLLMGEDNEMYLRVRRHGGQALHYPAAVVYQWPEPRRLTRGYVARWFYHVGQWHAFLERSVAPTTLPRILGVPRTLIRSAVLDTLAGLGSLVTGRPAAALRRAMRVVAFAGYTVETFQRRLG